MTYVVFHVQFEVLLANGIDLHLYGICDTLLSNRDIWHTGQPRDRYDAACLPIRLSHLTVGLSLSL